MNANAEIARRPEPEDPHLYVMRCFFLLSILLSAAGRNAYYVGTTWILAISGGTAGSIALFLAFGSVVEFLISVPAGYLVDRIERRFLCMASDAVRILVLLTMSAVLFLGKTDYALYGSVIIYAMADRVYLIASSAMVPSIARPKNLVSFNSLGYVAMQTGNMLAALAAGWLLDIGPQLFCFFFSAGTFAASVLAMSRVAICNPNSGLDCQNRVSISPHLSGMAKSSRVPLLLLVSYALIYAMGMLISALISKLVQQELAGSAADFGALESYWAVGAIVSMLIMMFDRFREADGRVVPIIVIMSGIAVASFHLTRDMSVAFALMAFLGAGYNLTRVLVDVEIQKRVSNAILGRVKGNIHVACMGSSLLLYTILAILGEAITPAAIFLFFGSGMIICIGFGYMLKAARERFSSRRGTPS